MSKIKQISIPLDDNLDIILDNISNWKLVCEHDGLTHYAHKISWVEWGKLDEAVKNHDEPAIGRSLMLNPHILSYGWLTTIVTEIIEQKEKYIKFKTLNSVYELFKLN